MAEYVGPAIEVGKCIAEPIKRQFNYLCCFNSNIQNLRDEDTKLDNIKVGVDAAMTNVQVITPEVKAWLNEVNMIQVNMSRIDSEILNVKSGCLAIKSRFLLSRKATKMAAAMKELQDGRGNFGQICHPPPPAAMASSIPVGQTYELETRKHFEEKIMATLREKKVRMMGICGMGGVGKTTMAKIIMSRARGESLFDEIMMVVVSQPVDMLRIQKDMAELLGLKLEVESLAARAHQLRIRLTNAKSILIVFDDLWKSLMLEDLGIPDQKECTILLTSRDVDVFKQMGVEKPYQFQMKILNYIEALSLFKEKVGARVDDPRLSPIAEKIVRECQGLPLALVTVGLALKDEEDKAIWENAEQELTTCKPEGIPNYIEKVYNPLRLSYDKLGNNEHAKSTFLLCCLFPEDHEICISYLGLYAWGLGMFKGIKSLRAARNKVQASVKTLKSRSLLLDGYDERYVKMHDVVRDVGIFIAEKQGLMNPPNWQGEDRHCTWISLFDAQKITLPEGSAFPKLQFLLIEGQRSSPKELPVEIGRLNQLKLLHIEECWNLTTIAAGVISKLISLEELTLLYTFRKWESGASEAKKNAALCELNNLSRLTTLRIQIEDASLAAEQIHLPNVVEFNITIGRPIYRRLDSTATYGRAMQLKLERDANIGDRIHKFSRSSEMLALHVQGSSKLIMLEKAMGNDSLLRLESLTVKSCSMLEQVMLWNEEEVNGESSRITFPKLKGLRLYHLPRLTSFCKGIQGIEFPLLIQMKILKCPNLKSVVSSTENDHICSGAINHDSLHLFCKSQVAFGMLEYLIIDGYENTSSERSWSLWCDQIPADIFTGLVYLKVSNCGNIKSLFSPSIAKNLVNLKLLIIESCFEMVKVIEDEVDEVERSPFINLKDFL